MSTESPKTPAGPDSDPADPERDGSDDGGAGQRPILAAPRKLVADTLFISLAGLLSRTKGVVFIPLIVGAVGLADYGAFIQIFVTAKLITALCTLELGLGFERFVAPLDDEDAEGIGRHFGSILTAVLLLSGLGALLMLALAPAISAAFLEGGHVASLRIAAAVTVSNAVFATTRTFLWSRRRFAHQSAFSLGYELCPYIAFVVAVVATGQLLPGIVAYAALDAAAAGVMLLYALRGLSFQRPSGRLVRSYARYTAPLAFSNLEGGLLSRVDRFFIAGMLGLEPVAVYNIAYRCTELVGFPSTAIRPQMMSYLSAAWERGAERESRAVIRTAVLSFLAVTLGLLASLALFADGLFTHFLGETASTEPLWVIVVLVGIGTLANASRRFLAVYVRLQRKTGAELGYQTLGLTVNVIGNLILIPVAGLAGAAAATLIAYVAVLPLYTRRCDFGFDRAFFAHLGSFAVLALLLAPLGRVLPTDGIVVLLASLAASYLLYVLLVVLFKRRFLLDVRAQVAGWQRSSP